MGLILDTSILVAAERRQFAFESFLDAAAVVEKVYVAAITASELLHGVHRASSSTRLKREKFVENVLLQIPTLSFDLSCARVHSSLWADLEAKGLRIGLHDLMISATCLYYGHSIATLNEREFRRVEGLELVNVREYVVGF